MSGIRKSVYVGDALEKALSERKSDHLGHSTSQIINMMADRYMEVVRRSIPDLSANEWFLLFDALNGTITWDHAGKLTGEYIGVSEVIELDGLAEKWNVDGPDLVYRLKSMPYCQTLAWIDVCERFWGFGSRTWETNQQVFDALGINPAR